MEVPRLCELAAGSAEVVAQRSPLRRLLVIFRLVNGTGSRAAEVHVPVLGLERGHDVGDALAGLALGEPGRAQQGVEATFASLAAERVRVDDDQEPDVVLIVHLTKTADLGDQLPLDGRAVTAAFVFDITRSETETSQQVSQQVSQQALVRGVLEQRDDADSTGHRWPLV